MLAVSNLDKASPLDALLGQDILQLTAFFPGPLECRPAVIQRDQPVQGHVAFSGGFYDKLRIID